MKDTNRLPQDILASYVGFVRGVLRFLLFFALAFAAAAIVVVPTWLFATNAPHVYALVVGLLLVVPLAVFVVRRAGRWNPTARAVASAVAKPAAIIGLIAGVALFARGLIAAAIPVVIATIVLIGLAPALGRFQRR